MKTIKLTPQLEQQILAAIRAGGFPHVAAAAFGVSSETLEKWRKRSKALDNRINQAQAQARLTAEMKAFEDEPKLWLRSGPGKETPDNQGWTAIVRPHIHEHRTINVFNSPDFMAFMATLRAALAPFPEALKALTYAVEQKPKAITDYIESKKVIPQDSEMGNN